MAGIEVAGSNQTVEQVRDYFRRRPRQGNQNEIDGSNGSTGAREVGPRSSRQRSKCESLGILTGKPKHKQYSTLDARIKSFDNVNWDQAKTPDIQKLAKAGLAYTGVDDSVRCFYCSIGLKDWPINACPWEQHILASPDCGHVAQCKGKAYIRKILGESDEDSDVEVDDSNEYVDTVKEAMKRNEASVTAARLYCTNQVILNRAVKSLIRSDRQRTFSSLELMSAIEEIGKESKNRNQSERTNVSQTDSGETDGETSESDEEDEEQNRKLKDPITCKICFNAIACIITLPCGHMVSCPQCVSALSKCAVCRADIKGTVRALMAV